MLNRITMTGRMTHDPEPKNSERYFRHKLFDC